MKIAKPSLKLDPVKISAIRIKKEHKQAVKTAEEITAECAEELSEQAKHIKMQEGRLKERMDFDNDRAYYFSIVFRSTDERDAFLKSKRIKLKSDTYAFYDDIKDLFI